MTYCVGIALREGLIMIADTRTNAGIDNISTYRKMHVLADTDDRLIVCMSAGNLSVTQHVLGQLAEGLPALAADEHPRLLTHMPSMFRATQLIGEAVMAAGVELKPALRAAGVAAGISLLVGGRIGDGPTKLYLIYDAGNFIECCPDTPFLQIGATAYGKPILDRAMNYDSPLDEAVKVGLLSFDSTIRSDLSVGLPFDVVVIPTDPARGVIRRRIEADDAYFQDLSNRWSMMLNESRATIPDPPFMTGGAPIPRFRTDAVAALTRTGRPSSLASDRLLVRGRSVRKLFTAWFGLSLTITSPAIAAGPFDGTWKADLGSAALSKKPDVVLLKGGTYSCSTCVPVFTVPADGASHAMTGFPYFDEAALTVVDARTIREIDKLKGKVVSTSTSTLSGDGKTLTTDWVDNSAPDGKPVTGRVVQERAAPVPAGAHPISGAWRSKTIGNLSDSAITMTFATSGDMFSMKTPNGYGYDAKVGGPAVPFTGDTANTMIAIARPDPMTIVETDTRDAKPIGRYTMTVAAGGKILKVLSENLQKNTQTSYTMLKQ